MRTGLVYKLSIGDGDEECEKVYIGSTKSPYISIRMAHHRERHHKGRQDYQGIFDNGDPNCEILETIEFDDCDDWKLRKAEQKWAEQTKNTINIRRCYISPNCRKKERDARIKKYHQSEKGKLALRKSQINYKLKNPPKKIKISPEHDIQGLVRELIQINEKQAVLASLARTPEVPLAHRLHQSDEVLSDKE